MFYLLLTIALIIVSALAFYAGTLLFKLKAQQQKKQLKTQERINTICHSIQTIAKATQQQQCNLSEASIRLFHLFEALPINDKAPFQQKFPNLFALYDKIKDLPTHDARKSQSKLETRKQDFYREDLEAQMESSIRPELDTLAAFEA